MTRHTPPRPATPVITGLFPDGPDSVLVNPAVSDRRWRTEYARAGLTFRIVLTGLLGTALAVLGGLAASSGGGAVAGDVVAFGVLTVGASVVIGRHRATRLLVDHRHGAASPCRLDRTRGEFFMRSRDFADLGCPGAAAVRELICGVDELHRSPARGWFGPELCREVHRVVWESLSVLERTREARTLASELARDPDTEVGDLAAAAREAIAVIDAGLAEVVGHMRGCLALSRAWEAKLRHAELATRTDRTLSTVPGHDHVLALGRAAEALPRTLHAFLTAARDLTGAGPFPWERPASSWLQVPGSHDGRGGAATARRKRFRRDGPDETKLP
ncbi:Uncharacterised protein [Amycolatopsis camponoti]|uniref:Uncharacterized protein n=1 Tax=Amycolatopsis camponoti TaxID=2606593 RepID=A0A6I8M4Z9_9PSEU|nr:hypothetical protein [Amycolatopsis camponoti]VVJ22713.1 Uncharacterised protein [Amycolatopsis camponoti]